MTWFLILFIYGSHVDNYVKIEEPSYEVCKSVGTEQTTDHSENGIVKTGTYWDGKPWTAVEKNSAVIRKSFYKFTCVQGLKP